MVDFQGRSPRDIATMRVSTITLLSALSLVCLQAQAGGDVIAGKLKAAEVCSACHGLDGNSENPIYPIIAGQHASYLRQSLHDYKSGARKNAIMQGFATQLSEEDIDNLSAYYASQSGPLYTLDID